MPESYVENMNTKEHKDGICVEELIMQAYQSCVVCTLRVVNDQVLFTVFTMDAPNILRCQGARLSNPLIIFNDIYDGWKAGIVM